jgi:hypothetical protein
MAPSCNVLQHGVPSNVAALATKHWYIWTCTTWYRMPDCDGSRPYLGEEHGKIDYHALAVGLVSVLATVGDNSKVRISSIASPD